jgi:hypothetical protein
VAAEGAEAFRALLPVGYPAGVEAYQQAVAALTVRNLTHHYTDGLRWFHEEFVPRLKARLTELSGGVWSFADYEAYAAGSDVDFITHLVEAVAAREPVCLFPGDWFGFCAGLTQQHNVRWDRRTRGRLACLCVPSVRNGHVTEDMAEFLDEAEACLLNLNLYPTLTAPERRTVAERLAGVLGRSVLSISFSRGFGLTASQLGVALVHRDHPLRARFAGAWDWHTYFYNAVAARAFLAIDGRRLEAADAGRRRWVADWLRRRGLPAVESGSYYVKSFRLDGPVPEGLRRLARAEVVRLCFRPPSGE